MTEKSPNTDPIDASRKILNTPVSAIAELEAAHAVIQHVIAETDAEIEDMARRRKTIAAGDASVAAIEAALHHHDAAVRALKDKNEIAGAVDARLRERIAADCEAERVAEEIAKREELATRRTSTSARVRDYLTRIGREGRQVLREYLALEVEIERFNRSLPKGAPRIASDDADRRVSIQPPKVLRERKFVAFTINGQIIEEGRVTAAYPNADGKWRISLPSQCVAGRIEIPGCDRVQCVEREIEEEIPPSPKDSWVSVLRIPSFVDGEPDWWDPTGRDFLHHLDNLESIEPHRRRTRITTRFILGAAAVAAPAPPALAAE